METTDARALIWILEDSQSSQFVYEETLGSRYRLHFFSSLGDFRQAMAETAQKPRLLLADLRLQDENFLDFLGTDEAHTLIRFPFMVVSSLDDLDVLRTCFQEGALDYLTKPFTRNELIVKIERILEKRSEISLDPGTFRLRRKDGSLLPQLTPKELQIFTLLQAAKGAPVTRQSLTAEIWGTVQVTSKSLDVHLFHLRRKIAEAGFEIVFEPQKGFILLEVQPVEAN